MFKKTLVIAAVAMFCFTAFAAMATTDDSDAASPKVSYDIYLQLNDGTHSYSGWIPTQKVAAASTTDYSDANFAAALSAGCEAEGFTVDLAGSWINSITVKGTTYTTSDSSEWGTNYWGPATYYLKNDDTWGHISTYNEGGIIAVVFDKYEFTDPQNPDKYYDDTMMGCWERLPDVAPVEYKIYLQLNDGTHSFAKWLPTVSALNVSKTSYYKAIKAACEEAGIDTDCSDSSVSTFTVDGNTYTNYAWGSDPYWGCAHYYKKSDTEWALISNYCESSVVSIVYDQYLFAEPTESASSYIKDPYMDQWTHLPNVAPSDANPKAADNLILYAGIGAVVVVIIAALAFFLIRRGA